MDVLEKLEVFSIGNNLLSNFENASFFNSKRELKILF
jgi:hypothetical protein